MNQEDFEILANTIDTRMARIEAMIEVIIKAGIEGSDPDVFEQLLGVFKETHDVRNWGKEAMVAKLLELKCRKNDL